MPQFKNILCVFDTGEICKETMEKAVSLASQNQGRLTTLAVTEPLSNRAFKKRTDPTSIDPVRLETLVGPYRKYVEIQTKVMVGTPFLEIVREVLRNEHDLVIKRPVPRARMKRFYNHTDKHLFSKCPCSVWFNETSIPKSRQVILAVVDVSDEYHPTELSLRLVLNQQILELASSMAIFEDAELHIMQAWRLVGESAMKNGFIRMPNEKILSFAEQIKQESAAKLDALIDDSVGDLELNTRDAIKPRIHLVKGWEQNEIPALAKKIDANLIIMGTIVRHGVYGYILGNNARNILRWIDSSLLVLK